MLSQASPYAGKNRAYRPNGGYVFLNLRADFKKQVQELNTHTLFCDRNEPNLEMSGI